MKCPHCGKKDNSTTVDRAKRNAESYGSGCFVLRCPHCKKKYSFYMRVTTQIENVTKEEESAELSYGN